ncbi:MAG: catalase [Leptospiraceae bacterium]|nr:catalase [Leptospiraceae bacterium]
MLLSHDIITDLAHFNREKIPERITHAKGTGAFGEFICSKDLAHLTKAKLFREKVKCRIAVRFSNYKGEKGTPDTIRDPRGFAVKFYTEEGNLDIAGNNIPIFYIRDPKKFPELIHSQKRNPETNLYSNASMWKFFSENPETLHGITMNFSRRGIPRSYRHIHGYSCHAIVLQNDKEEIFYAKFHFLSNQGIQTLSDENAKNIAGVSPDFYTEDLIQAIERKDFPSWKVFLQVVSEKDLSKFSFDPFDVTKVWQHSLVPLTEIGEFVLNELPKDHFTQVEQIAFSPANLISGMDLSPDELLHARVFSYADAQRHRLGVNYSELKVNQSEDKNFSHRDGQMRMENANATPKQSTKSILHKNYDKSKYKLDEFTQVRDLFQLFTEEQREELFQTIADSLKESSQEVIDKQIDLFQKVSPEYAIGVKGKIIHSLDESTSWVPTPLAIGK